MIGGAGKQAAGDASTRVDTETGNPNQNRGTPDVQKGLLGSGFELKDINEKLYRLVSQILHSMEKLQLILRLLSILEFLQILFFVISKQFPNMWNANVFTYLQTVTDFVNLDRVLLEGTESAINSMVFTISGVHMSGVFIFISMVWFTPVQGAIPEVLNFFVKFFTLYLFALRSVLIVPSAQVAYVGYLCDPNSPYTSAMDCTDSGIRATRGLLSTIIIVLLALQIVGMGVFMIDLNPLNTSPLASFDSYYGLRNDFLKMLLPIYMVFLQKSGYQAWYLGIVSFSYGGLLLFESLKPPRASQIYDLQIKLKDALICYISGCTFVLLLWEKGELADNVSLWYALIGLLPVIYLVMTYDQFSSLARLKRGVNYLKHEEEFAKYIYSMALLTERCLEPAVMTQLRLGLKRLLFESRSNRWLSSMTSELKSHLHSEAQPPEFRTQTYAILAALAEKYRGKFSSTSYVSLLLAHILYTKLSLKWKAIYEIEFVNQSSGSARMKIASYRFLHVFHTELNEFEVKQKSEGVVDVTRLMSILKGFSLLNEKITITYSLYFDFWMLLGSEKPDVKIAKRIGIKINTYNSEIRRAYDRLLEQNPNQTKTILLYANYLRYVVNDREEADRIASKASNLMTNTRNTALRNSTKEDTLNYSDASSLCIIIVSGESNTLGLIRSMNSETLRKLDLTSDDIKGKYISSLMPKIYGDHHNYWMRSYIEANKDFTVKHPPTVFVNTSRGNMLRCTLHLKMIANNRDRLEMAGLLLPVVFEDGAEQVLIDAQTGEMYGATSGCKRKFGIPSELCYGSEKRTGVLNIKQVFPKTSTVEELKEIAETNALMTMDTTLIPAIFQLDRNDPASQDASPFGITANYKQHSVRVRVKEIDLKPENGEITKLLCLEIWKDKSYVQGYATFLHTFSQAAAPNYLTVTGTANQEPSSVSNVGTSQIQSLGSGGNSPSMREAVVEMPMEKEESESEIQRMILYQDRIRKLREKRSQINSNSSTLKVTAFSIGPFMLGVVMIIYFIVSFSLSSSVRSLLEGSVQSQHKLAEMITILPSIATLANRAYLLSTGELQDTQYFNQRSLPQMIKHQQESFQQAENDLRTEILKMVDLDSKWQLETGQFFQSDKLHGDYNTLVSMDLTDATYQLVLSCENIVLLLTNSTSAMIDTRVMADSYQFMYKNYASSFRRYYLYLQGEFKSLYSKLLRSQGNQILFVFIGTLLLFVLIFIGMIMMLFRISEEMMCIPQVMSELKLTDIASALSNLRHYEGDLIKQKVVGNSLYKVSSEINPEDIELESQNFTKTGGVFGRRRSLKNSAQKEKTIVRKEFKARSKSIKKTEMALDAKLPKPPGRISLKGLLLVAQVPKIFRNNINNRARANSGNVIKINAPNHPTAVKTIARQIEVPAVGYKRRMSLSKVKPLSNKQAQDRASIMINKSYHRAVTKMEKRRSLQGKNNSLGSKHNSDDEHLNTEHGKFEEPRVNQKDLEKDSIFSFVKRWQLSLALIGIPFAILAFFQLYQSLSTIDIFQTEITLLANIKVGSSYLTSFTFQNATSGKVFTDGIVENATQHESDSLFNLLEELKWTDTVSLPATFESYMNLRGKLTDADLCTSFESGIQSWIGRYVAAFGYLTPSYLCTSNSKVSKGAVTTLYWMIDEVTQASRGLNYKFSALNKQGLFDFTSPLQDIQKANQLLEACLLHLTEALLQGVKDYSSETQTIVMILSVLTSIGLLGMQYWYWLPLVENLRAKISKDRRVLNVIPFDWIMNDEKLYTQFDKLNI